MSGSSPLPCEPVSLFALLSLHHPVLSSLFPHDKHTDLNPPGVLKNCEVHVHPNVPKTEVTLHVYRTVASPRKRQTPPTPDTVAVSVVSVMEMF